MITLLPKRGGILQGMGKTIHVTWTKANLTGVSYQLQFFDGVSWSTLANGLKST